MNFKPEPEKFFQIIKNPVLTKDLYYQILKNFFIYLFKLIDLINILEV